MIAIRPLLLVVLLATSTLAQTTKDSSTSAKVALANSLAIISGGQHVSDVILNGTLSRDTGDGVEKTSATLKGKGTTASRLNSMSSAKARSEVWALANGLPACQWTDTKGTTHVSPAENCLVPVWFLPQLSPLANVVDSSAQAVFVGHEERSGEPVDHYTISRVFVPVPSKPRYSVSSQVEIYLDSATQIPVALMYQAHPDDDLGANLAVEVRFSDYRLVNGAFVPFRVARLLNGATVLDFTVTSVTLNAGVSDSEFSLQ